MLPALAPLPVKLIHNIDQPKTRTILAEAILLKKHHLICNPVVLDGVCNATVHQGLMPILYRFILGYPNAHCDVAPGLWPARRPEKST